MDMLPLLEQEAKERQRSAGELHGRGKEKVTQKIGEAIDKPKHDGEAATKAAKVMGTNRQYVSELIALVTTGINVPTHVIFHIT